MSGSGVNALDYRYWEYTWLKPCGHPVVFWVTQFRGEIRGVLEYLVRGDGDESEKTGMHEHLLPDGWIGDPTVETI